MTDIPYWRSHKTVQAAKIKAIHPTQKIEPSTALLVLEGAGDVLISEVVAERMYGMRGNGDGIPGLVGGYYVRYADGYESWSPAKAFEEGYTLLGGAAPGLGSSHVKVEGARFCPACGVPVNEMDRQPCMVPA